MDELKRLLLSETGSSDETLVSYIFSLCKESKERLQSELSDFSPEFINKIYDVVNPPQPEGGEKHLVVDFKVPKFLSNEPDLHNALTTANIVQLDNQNETWLQKSARVTNQKVASTNLKSKKLEKPTLKAPIVPQDKKEKVVLPVLKYKSLIVESVMSNSVVIVVGDTGSGKTTQITQFLRQSNFSSNGKIIACTQPRRLAAISIARRVSTEMGVQLGEEVGYTVRFDDCSSKKTEIKFMTDGILEREICSDLDLTKYSAIMLDEAHERTVATDVLLALLKSAAARRPDLKVIVTSATLDAEKFAEYFGGGVPILRIPGKAFKVDIHYSNEPILDYMESALATVKHIHEGESTGDILVFLTGQAEIDLAVGAIQKGFPNGDLIPVPVYAAIPSEQQAFIFNPAPKGKRKVVFATNIAETSLTIDGIVFVVDTGFSKVQVWDANRGMGVLQIQPISQAQANQRSGRAGRTGPGKCFRLYTKTSFEKEMPKSTVPEILRANLGHTMLNLKAMGIKDVQNFDFIDKPSRASILSSLNELFLLGALDEGAKITKLGLEMSRFPLDPGLAKVLVTAKGYGEECLHNAIIVIAMMSMPNVFYRPSQPPAKQKEADRAHLQFKDATGDHLTLLKVYYGFKNSNQHDKRWCDKNYIQYKTMTKVLDAIKQLADLVNTKVTNRHVNITNDLKTKLLKCLCSGFFQNVAKYSNKGAYTTLANQLTVNIHPSSSLFRKDAQYVLYSSLIMTSKEYMHVVSEIKPEWLVDAVSGYYTFSKKRLSEEPLQPLFKRFQTHANEWRVSEHHKTLTTQRRL